MSKLEINYVQHFKRDTKNDVITIFIKNYNPKCFELDDNFEKKKIQDKEKKMEFISKTKKHVELICQDGSLIRHTFDGKEEIIPLACNE